MITKVFHDVPVGGPAGITLALEVAQELHAPAAPPRAAEVVSVPELMGLRTSAARPHRRKVPLHRLNAMRGLAVLSA
ncbi:hypothetical protein ACIHEJ_20270 [Streptomyces sp. NPDC052301]|uniref:hypothetical protein n=1 Tax=Streptomyces sp. NPDC052301 TaxID=3365687 RepID=UPI0037D6BA90